MGQTFVVRLVMRASQDSIMTDTSLERRTTKGTSSGRITDASSARLYTRVQAEARKSRRTTKLFAQVRPDGQCVLSMKAANELQ